MSAYLTSVITVGALISLALAVSYRSGGAEKTAFMIFLLYVSALPLIGIVRDFEISEITFNFNEGTEYKDAFGEVTREAYENGIRLYIADEYSLDAEDISVRAEGFDAAAVRARVVVVTLSGDARYADYRDMSRRLEKNGLGRCEVKIAI